MSYLAGTFLPVSQSYLLISMKQSKVEFGPVKRSLNIRLI